MRFEINRLGSRPGEFHPVESAPLFESEDAAAPYIAKLVAKSAKRNKFGPAAYAALPIPGPGQSRASFDQEFLAMVEEGRKTLANG